MSPGWGGPKLVRDRLKFSITRSGMAVSAVGSPVGSTSGSTAAMAIFPEAIVSAKETPPASRRNFGTASRVPFQQSSRAGVPFPERVTSVVTVSSFPLKK